MKSREWYLDQLGITQYAVRNAAVFGGEAAIVIAERTRLLLVADTLPTAKIFSDVLKAINLSLEQVQLIKPHQLAMLPAAIACPIWLLDYQAEISDSLAKQALIQTADLATLAQSKELKRQLWQTLCRYENYFQA